MTVLEQRLKDQKRLRQEASKASERPRQYTPVDIPLATKEDSGSGSYNSDGSSRESPAMSRKTKQLPSIPPANKDPAAEESKKTITATTEAESVTQVRQQGKVKPMLPPVTAKPKRPMDHCETSTQETPKSTGHQKQAPINDFLQELKKKTDQSSTPPKAKKTTPTPMKRPKPSTKPSVSNEHQTSQQQPTVPDPCYEQPEYANTNFDLKRGPAKQSGRAAGRDVPTGPTPPDDDSIYMNLQPAPLPTRRKASSKSTGTPQSEYQNIGIGLKKKH